MNLFLQLLFLAAIGGALPVTIKLGVVSLSVLDFTFYRYLLAAIVLYPFYIKNRITSIKKKHLIFLTIIFFLINSVAFAVGIKGISASVGQLLYLLTPIIVLLGTIVFLKKSVTPTQYLGTFLGISGSFITILPYLSSTSEVAAIVIILLGVLGYSLYQITSKKISRDLTPIQLTFIQCFSVTLTLGVISVFSPSNSTDIFNLSYLEVFAVVYSGVIGGALFFGLLQRIINIGGSLHASSVVFLQPVFTFIWSSVVFGEEISVNLVIGGLISILGAYFVTK